MIFLVAASERERAQTVILRDDGVVGPPLDDPHR